MRPRAATWLAFLFISIPLWASEPSSPPAIATLLKPVAYRRMIDEREVMAHAKLEDDEGELKRYSYYAAMKVRGSLGVTRRVLSDYALYAKMIPYIDRAAYDPVTRLLDIEGGIFKFKLRSQVAFEEKSDRWIRYRVVGGHFEGLTGDIFFESLGERGVLVFIRGSHRGKTWPPKFVLERGAEIVFEFTAKRMRSYIEANPS